MPSSYSNLGIQLMATGEQAGNWGTFTNTNLSLIDNSINGYVSIPVTSTSLDIDVPNITGSPGVGQNRILLFTNSGANPTGTANIRITKNGSATSYYEGWYFVTNNTGRTINIYQGTTYVALNSVTIPNGQDVVIYCDGTGVVKQFFTNTKFDSIGVGTAATANYRVRIAAENTTSAYYAALFEDSAGTNLAYIRADGAAYFNGNIGVGVSPTANWRLRVYAGGTTSAYYAAFFEDSAGANLFYIRADGLTYNYNDFTNAKNMGVGVSASTNYRFRVYAEGTTATYYACSFEDSAGTNLFYVKADGIINTGTKTNSPFNKAIPTGKQLAVDSSGNIGYVPSSIKYKTDVQNINYGLTEVMQLRSVSYRPKDFIGENDKNIGFIAEEVDAIGLKEFVYYKDGEPDSLNYPHMVSLLTKAIQEQQAMIEDLKARVAALGG